MKKITKLLKPIGLFSITCFLATNLYSFNVQATEKGSIESITLNCEVEEYGETAKSFEIKVSDNVSLDTISAEDFIIENAVINHLGNVGDIKAKDVKVDGNTIKFNVDDFLSFKSDGSVIDEELKVICKSNEELSFAYNDITKISSPVADKFESKVYNGLNYKLFSPSTLEAKPLVVWMHGRGDNGLQIRSAKNAIMFAEDNNQAVNPCYVLAPQSDESEVALKWTDNELNNIISVIKSLIDEGKVDKDRVYILGHSMGGQGTWNILRKEPKLFAAAITMAPRVISEQAELDELDKLKDLPVWLFHAESDPINTIDGSTDRYNMLIQVGNTKVKYTKLNDNEMNSFGIGFLSPYEYHATNVVMVNTPEVYDWLFSQTRETVVEEKPIDKVEDFNNKTENKLEEIPSNDSNKKTEDATIDDSIPQTGDVSTNLILTLGGISLISLILCKKFI